MEPRLAFCELYDHILHPKDRSNGNEMKKRKKNREKTKAAFGLSFRDERLEHVQGTDLSFKG